MVDIRCSRVHVFSYAHYSSTIALKLSPLRSLIEINLPIRAIIKCNNLVCLVAHLCTGVARWARLQMAIALTSTHPAHLA